MTIDSFAEYLIAHVQTNLPGNYCDATFTIIHSTKPGNRKATGIGICKPISDIAPCIYIDELYAQYSKGMNLTALTNAFAKLIMNSEQIPDFQPEYLKDFEKAKDYIVSRLIDIRPAHNGKYLKGRPVKRLGNTDIGIIYELDISQFFEKQCFSVPITNALMKSWDIQSLETIAIYAAQNTPRLRPAKISTMSDIIKPFMDTENNSDNDNPDENTLIITNTDSCFGANVILYPEVQETLNNRFPNGYYIIPSSVHEMLIVPQSFLFPIQLLEIVITINKTEVRIDEILADDIFTIKNGTLISVI